MTASTCIMYCKKGYHISGTVGATPRVVNDLEATFTNAKRVDEERECLVAIFESLLENAIKCRQDETATTENFNSSMTHFVKRTSTCFAEKLECGNCRHSFHIWAWWEVSKLQASFTYEPKEAMLFWRTKRGKCLGYFKGKLSIQEMNTAQKLIVQPV